MGFGSESVVPQNPAETGGLRSVPGETTPTARCEHVNVAQVKVGMFIRAVAFCIDETLLVVSAVGLWVVVMLVSGFLHAVAPSASAPFTFFGVPVRTVVRVVWAALGIAYFVGFVGWRGQTLGMMGVGIKVVPVEGGRMTYGRALERFIGFCVSGLPFFYGWLTIDTDPDRQGWHDRIAKTYVVKAA